MRWLVRFFKLYRWQVEYERGLARRVKVEQELLKMAKGYLPLPDARKCFEMAQRLGVPERLR